MLKLVGLTLLVLAAVNGDEDKGEMKEFNYCWKNELMKEISTCADELKEEDKKDDGKCMHKAMACLLRKHDALTPEPEENVKPEQHQAFVKGMAANEIPKKTYAVGAKLCKAASSCYDDPNGGKGLEAYTLCFSAKLKEICSKPSE